MASEAELLARIKVGDHRALAELYDLYGSIVYSFAVRILRDTATAESVVQEVFLTVWRKAEQFQPERGSFCTWLLTVTRNKAIDAARSSSKRESRYVSVSLEPAVYEAPVTSDPLSSAIQSEQREVIRRALGEIPDEQKLPIYLSFYGDLSHQEISEKLAVPLGTVKTRIRLGLEKLRLALRQRPE